MKLKLKQNIGMSVDIAVGNTAQKWKKIKLLSRKIKIEKEATENKLKIKIKMKLKLKQKIGMSVHSAVGTTHNGNEIKLMNIKIQIENKEIKWKMELK